MGQIISLVEASLRARQVRPTLSGRPQVEERSGFSQQYPNDLERGRRNPTIRSQGCTLASGAAKIAS
jgi:hypothetical protein